MTHRTLAVLAGVMLTMTLGACSAGPATPAPSPSTTESTDRPGLPNVGDGTPKTPLPAAVGLQNIDCRADKDGKWSFSAVIKNPDESDAVYTVTPSVIDTQGKVVSSTSDDFEVDSQSEHKVSFDSFAQSPAGAKGLVCSVSVVKKR